MKKNIFIILGAIVVCSALFLLVNHFRHNNRVEITNTPLKSGPIVAFGDSLVAGYGATPGNDFVSDLSKEIGKPIINKGQNGDTTAEALDRIKEVLGKSPSLIIILLGGNDFLHQVSKDTTFSNLSKIITTIQDSGAAVILLGIQGGLLSDPYKQEFENLSATYKTAYVANVLSGLIGHDQYMSDGVHPNDAGYLMIANKVKPIIDDILNR